MGARRHQATKGTGDGPRRRRRRATYNRDDGVRHLLAAYDLGADEIYGHVKTTKNRTKFLEFCRYLRSLYPPEVRIAIVMDNFSPHLSTKKDQRVGIESNLYNSKSVSRRRLSHRE